jgi:hypothetical protein
MKTDKIDADKLCQALKAQIYPMLKKREHHHGRKLPA